MRPEAKGWLEESWVKMRQSEVNVKIDVDYWRNGTNKKECRILMCRWKDNLCCVKLRVFPWSLYNSFSILITSHSKSGSCPLLSKPRALSDVPAHTCPTRTAPCLFDLDSPHSWWSPRLFDSSKNKNKFPFSSSFFLSLIPSWKLMKKPVFLKTS